MAELPYPRTYRTELPHTWRCSHSSSWDDPTKGHLPMDSTDVIIRVMLFALAGWIAASYRIVHSRLDPRWRRLIIVPLWFAWMSFALGGPVYTGELPLVEAISTG